MLPKHCAALSGVLIQTVAGSAAAVSITVESEIGQRLAQGVLERTCHTVIYDDSYRRIDYPGGDVPQHMEVCTDMVIRSYRQ